MIPEQRPEVVQVDREAAARLVEWQQAATAQWKQDGEPAWPFFSSNFPSSIRAGTWDDHDVVQAFATHRIAGEKAALKQAARRIAASVRALASHPERRSENG